MDIYNFIHYFILLVFYFLFWKYIMFSLIVQISL